MPGAVEPDPPVAYVPIVVVKSEAKSDLTNPTFCAKSDVPPNCIVAPFLRTICPFSSLASIPFSCIFAKIVSTVSSAVISIVLLFMPSNISPLNELKSALFANSSDESPPMLDTLGFHL